MHGLYGNFGLRYGPLPTQIYQVLLGITSDPLVLAMLRSGLCAGVTALSLLWLARSLRLVPWFAAAIALAPWVWQYQRVMWDASFAMPLGSLALAAAAAFFDQPARWKLVLAIGAAALLPFIHPQDLPLAVAIGGGLFLHRGQEWRRHSVAIGIVLASVCALNGPYLVELSGALAQRLGGAVQHGYPAGQPHQLAMLAPLGGGTLFSESQFGGEVVPAGHLPKFWPLASFVSRLIYPLAWGGIVVAAVGAFRRSEVLAEVSADIRKTICQVVLATLLLQGLLFGLMRVPAEPQYFFGTFAVHALLPWLLVDVLRWRRLGLALGAAYGVAAIALTLGGMVAIHRHGYAENPPRVALEKQVAIARALNTYSATTALTDVALYQRFPQALRSLRLLVSPGHAGPRPANGELVIRNVPGTPGIELLEIPRAEIPPGLTPLDVSPLPKNWAPLP